MDSFPQNRLFTRTIRIDIQDDWYAPHYVCTGCTIIKEGMRAIKHATSSCALTSENNLQYLQGSLFFWINGFLANSLIINRANNHCDEHREILRNVE